MEEADTGYLKSGVLPSWERLGGHKHRDED